MLHDLPEATQPVNDRVGALTSDLLSPGSSCVTIGAGMCGGGGCPAPQLPMLCKEVV